MHLKKLFSALFFILVSVSCSTFDFQVGEIKDFPSEIQKSEEVTQEKYPESNAVILFHGTDYEIIGIEDDQIVINIKTRIVKKIFKAKTYSEKNRLSSDDNEKLLSVSARLIKKNGEIQHIPGKDIFKTSTIFHYQGEQKENTSILFSNLKAEDGDIVDKKYEFIRKEPYSFSVHLLNIDSDVPVLRREINIIYRDGFFENEGAGWFLRHRYINGPKEKISESVTDGLKRISFVEKDIPERIIENMTEYNLERIRSFLLSISRYNSWESFSSYYFNKSISPALAISDAGILKETISRTVKTNSSRKEQIMDIVKYVRKLQYDSVKLKYVDDYSVLPPSRTIELQKGSSGDKSLLLKELLGLTGINSELIFVNDRIDMKLVEEFPDIMFLQRMVVRIKDPDNEAGWIYLDPNEKYNPPFFQSARNSNIYGLIIEKDAKNALIKTNSYKNENVPEISEKILIKMNSLEKASVEVKIVARNENYSKFKEMEEKNSMEVRDILSEYVFDRNDLVDITEYKIVPDELNSEIVTTFKAELTPLVLKNGEKYILSNVVSGVGFYEPLFRSDKKRTSSIFLGRQRNIELKHEVILPEGYEFKDNNEKEFNASIDDIIKTDRYIKYEAEKYVRTSLISYLKSLIPPEKESEYSEFLYKINKQPGGIVFVKKEGGK